MTHEQFMKVQEINFQVEEGSSPTLHGRSIDYIELHDGNEYVSVDYAGDHPKMMDWGITTAWIHFIDGANNTLISDRELTSIKLQGA